MGGEVGFRLDVVKVGDVVNYRVVFGEVEAAEERGDVLRGDGFKGYG